MPDAESLARRIPAWRRLYENAAARKTALLIVLALVWEGYARALNNPLLFPTLTATVAALVGSVRTGELPRAIAYTLKLLLEGYVLGLFFAAMLTALASVSKIGAEQLFYLMSRGLSEAEASAMIVSGFVEPITKELPLEYAVEMNRLIQLQMEGSVG